MSTPEEEEPPGREEFVASLTRFGEERGINVDFQARVNTKHIDLYKLWNVIRSKGGYDAVSAEKLAWRKVGLDFNLGSANAAAYAFALKTTYYKNLAAYEIKTLHGREPPPIEILEKLTAKGGDILSRTLENFRPPQRSSLVNGDSDSGGEGPKTPKDEKMDIDDPGSVGRSTRGLRQAPPQRIPFQPDVSSSRQMRHPSGHAQSPQPAAMAHTGYNYSASSNPNSAQFAIANYEPRPQMPLTLRPIMTPSYNAGLFEERQKLARTARKVELGLISPSTKGMMKPGGISLTSKSIYSKLTNGEAGFDGPNIYVRTLQGLRSQVPEEQDYALHHLVKISHERGDKYKFDAFPNLAEGLIEYVLGISSLFYDVKWEICYSDYEEKINVLDGIRGTPDILQRIQSLKRVDTPDEMESDEFGRKLTKILEAGLTIRNLSLLEDNAVYLSEMPQLRDFLSIALNLPSSPVITELKHYALDISEQVTKYWQMDESDPLYRSLLSQVNNGHDRGAILTSLRAVSRISMNLDDTNILKGVPVSVIKRICEWTLLDDEDFVGACLDFLYQFTAVPENVGVLLSNSNELLLPSFLGQLTRLLQHHARTEYVKTEATEAIAAASATEIPNVPQDLMDQFLKYEEPDRSNHWLKAVFEEDAESDITQIALWQAYQARFTEYTSPTTQLLPAAEFIKNVSTIFAGANAQVVNGINHKFIIKGIRPRHAPMDPKGRVYSRCLWKVPRSKSCGDFFLKPKYMFDHIVYDHLGIDRRPDGTWDFQSTTRVSQRPNDCFWSNCRHFTNGGKSPSPYQLGMHIKTHLPDVSNKAVLRQKNNRTPANQIHLPAKKTNGHTMSTGIVNVDPAQGREATYNTQMYQNTAVDELGNAAGLPLTSVLVLRNLARNIPKAAALLDISNRDAFRIGWMEKLFGPLKDRLIFVMAHNKPLAGYVSDVMGLLEKGSAP
ncbi:MAG: Chromatin structure-remodeling complex protein rsc9 [Alectoria fallacina]|uniref:Chromatin structure-remodeling complex protein rsc9 n=1 Tax=Alectoria fallacina TaxID=1903189 RepID=A0A8H3GBT9_9LECA|nr:MAG: Chromatin structure-remodeling complex protein rsc9 [Alectoria fallacina]